MKIYTLKCLLCGAYYSGTGKDLPCPEGCQSRTMVIREQIFDEAEISEPRNSMDDMDESGMHGSSKPEI